MNEDKTYTTIYTFVMEIRLRVRKTLSKQMTYS